jgi:hypothetical protein
MKETYETIASEDLDMSRISFAFLFQINNSPNLPLVSVNFICQMCSVCELT